MVYARPRCWEKTLSSVGKTDESWMTAHSVANAVTDISTGCGEAPADRLGWEGDVGGYQGGLPGGGDDHEEA